MENSTLSCALTGVVPAVCDAEAGERRRRNLTVFQANPPSVQVALRFVKKRSPKLTSATIPRRRGSST